MKTLSMALALLLIAVSGFAQTTITTSDLTYDIGGYYSMYNIASPHGVIGMTGLQGGPYVFDYSTGSTVDTMTFEYVDVTDGGHEADFPLASIAEKKTDGATSSWLYLDFENGVGRTNYGFYDQGGVPESPSVPFSPSIVDFPDNLSYQSYFAGATNFDVISGGFALDVNYEYSGFVDAYGTIILPDGMGEHACIQVNYEEKYTYNFMGTPIQYSYLRSYYYLAEDLGIVAILTSLEDDNAVPNNFNIANTIARLFESSKTATSAVEVTPDGFSLESNYPNPFNPQTTISFELPAAQNIRLGVYDLGGHLVQLLINGALDAGRHDVVWSGKDLAGRDVSSGVYYYRIDADGFSRARTMTLMK